MVFLSMQVLLLLLLILSSLLLLARRGRKGKLAPRPVGLPMLGKMHQLGLLPHRNPRDLARQHDPVMLLYLGVTRMLIVSSVSSVREVLRTRDADCCSRPAGPGPKLLSYGFRDVAFAPYGEKLREMPKLFVTEFVSMRRIKDAWATRQMQVEKLMAGLTPNMPVALGEHIYDLVNSIICAVAFGNVYGAENFHRMFGEALELQASFLVEYFFPNATSRLVDRLTSLAASRGRSFAAIDTFLEVTTRKMATAGALK